NQERVLEDVISKYTNKNILSSNESFQNTTQKLSDEVSFQTTLSPDDLTQILNTLLDTSLSSTDLDDYQNTVVQVIKDDAVVHINAQIENFRPTRQRNNINEVFSLALDAPLLGDVQFVENHQTKQKDIAVQDIENNLYLISNQGVVRWKKKLSGAILGRINQVDLFRNGRLQMAFSTPNKVYVLDRLGRDVGAFPLNFKDKITQAVSVFDYDKNKNYRFLVTQNKSLLMYDGNGKRVKGFAYKAKGVVHTAPQHIRYNGKDFIVFAAGKELKILNRRGQDRIRTKESVDFSDQDIFFYNNKFTTLDTQGDLVQVDMKGRVSRQTLGFDAQTQITTSSRTLVAQWANHLQIKDKKNTLDFGSYLPPQLFYLNDKIYIALTDQQAQKVTLFDSKGTVLSGFPVYGISKIDLSNADRDTALEFVCQSGTNELMMYQIY
ncbi:MAG: ribonuclease HII, partial [Flavobacteriaceae bacterium]